MCHCDEQITFYELESSVIARYKKSEGFIDAEEYPLPTGHLQRLVWSTLEYPETSWLAFVVSVVSECNLYASHCSSKKDLPCHTVSLSLRSRPITSSCR